MEYLDIDKPLSWPQNLADLIEHLSNENPEFKELDPSEEQMIPDDIRGKVLSEVEGLPIAVYHATKLLEHEISDVYENGLLALNSKMLAHRIERAFLYGCITKDFRDFLLTNGLRSADAHNRAGMLWVITSRDRLRDQSGFWRLLTFWGGEALRDNFRLDGEEHPQLKEIGEASVVQGVIQVDSLTEAQLGYFDITFNLFKAFARIDAREQRGGTLSLSSLPPENILSVITERREPELWADIAPISER